MLLLDEPGLSLHASAQADLLRFIDERLAIDYNGAFNTAIQKADIDDDRSIMAQLKHLNGDKDFNHYIPAKYMMENISNISFSDDTLERFEKVFADVNKLLQ